MIWGSGSSSRSHMASFLKPPATNVPVYSVFPQKPHDRSPFSQSASFVHPILSGGSLCSSMLLCFLLSVRHQEWAGVCSCAQHRSMLLHLSVTVEPPSSKEQPSVLPLAALPGGGPTLLTGSTCSLGSGTNRSWSLVTLGSRVCCCLKTNKQTNQTKKPQTTPNKPLKATTGSLDLFRLPDVFWHLDWIENFSREWSSCNETFWETFHKFHQEFCGERECMSGCRCLSPEQISWEHLLGMWATLLWVEQKTGFSSEMSW